MRYDHHPNPAIAYCIEVDAIEGLIYDARHGMAEPSEVQKRIDRAMDFRVGGDVHAVAAKDKLRVMATWLGKPCLRA